MHVSSVVLAALALGACSPSSNGSSSGSPTSDAGGGTAAGFSFTASNVDLGALGDLSNLPDVDITDASCAIQAEYADSRCFDPTKVKFTVITQPNQIKVGVYVAHDWRIEPNAALTVYGSFPIILVATGSFDLLGSINARAQGDQTVAGGYGSTNMSHAQGVGPGGGGAGSQNNAGGGASYCGVGGVGGVGAGGAAPAGGATYGTAQIVPLVGGSQGGGGASSDGGAGGGAIQLVAANSIQLHAGAWIDVGGGHGNWSGGGGGSGGAILLEAETVTIGGVLAANGGGGQGDPGGTGASDALASNQPAPGSKDGTNPAGGSGSAAATITGGAGQDGDTSKLIDAAGGGGGAGRIRINTKSGAADLGGATLSPDATTSCVTQGTLK